MKPETEDIIGDRRYAGNKKNVKNKSLLILMNE